MGVSTADSTLIFAIPAANKTPAASGGVSCARGLVQASNLAWNLSAVRRRGKMETVQNMMMVGPPGAGKTLIARSMPSILPRLSVDEALDITRVYSVADALPPDEPLIRHRPFRAPHHTISYAGLIGGGRWPKPGEISLAHRGVLFLDELPEFGTRMLEMLRQPLEDKIIAISRSSGSLTYPANFTLMAAMNPCPCGYWGDSEKECTCSTPAPQSGAARGDHGLALPKAHLLPAAGVDLT
jgi:hypothetical protein